MSDHQWPDAADLLEMLAEATGPGSRVRDAGILVAATVRPHATLLGGVVHPHLIEKSAALLHSILVWRPLDLWNAGLAWVAAFSLLMRNGLALEIPAWDQMVITEQITSHELDAVPEIAARLAPYLRMR